MLRACSVVAFLMAGHLADLALAGDCTWTGASSREWHDPANWQPASGVPGKSDHASIAGLSDDTTITLDRETPLGGPTFDPQARFRCTLEGERLVLGDGAVVRFKTLTKPGKDGSQTIACPILLEGRVEFRNENRWYLGAERLTLSGPISGAAPVLVMGGRLDLGSRITCVKNLIYEADAEWSGQTYCTLGGVVTVRKGATWQITNGGGCPTTLSASVEGEGNVLFGKDVDVMRAVARDTKTVLVDLRKAFLACVVNEGITVYPGGRWTCNDKLLNHDGMHTTGRGDQILAEMIAQGIDEALRP